MWHAMLYRTQHNVAEGCACEGVSNVTACKHMVCVVQSITLEYRMDQTVATADTRPVVLGRMPAHFAESMGAALRHVALQHLV